MKGLFIATWTNENRESRGYIKAATLEQAAEIAARTLQKGCRIESVHEAHSEPTPQSLCLNFKEPEYRLFG